MNLSINDKYLTTKTALDGLATGQTDDFIGNVGRAGEKTLVFLARHFEHFRANHIDANASRHIDRSANNKTVVRAK